MYRFSLVTYIFKQNDLLATRVAVVVEVEFCLYNNARSIAAIPIAVRRQHNVHKVIYKQLSEAQTINSILLSPQYIP